MKLNINGIELIVGDGQFGPINNLTLTNIIRVNRVVYNLNRDEVITNKDLASIATILQKADRDITELLTIKDDTTHPTAYPSNLILSYCKDPFTATIDGINTVVIGNKIRVVTANDIIAKQLGMNIIDVLNKCHSDVTVIVNSRSICLICEEDNINTVITFKP